MSRPRLERHQRTCARKGCENLFEVRENAADANRRYCTRQCARIVENQARSDQKRAEWLESLESLCPCGINRIPYEVRHTTLYCSSECRKTYSKKRQIDPNKWVTKACRNCGKDFEQRMSSQSYGYYCSNDCARRHTKTKQHIVVENAVVLDSKWEALFWGLAGFLKVPIERCDRDNGVAWAPGHWYAPDFYLPTADLYVEVKGQEDGQDQERWAAFRVNHRLAVVDEMALDNLRRIDTAEGFVSSLLFWVHAVEEAVKQIR